MTDHWPPVADTLGEALHRPRIDSSLYTRSEFNGVPPSAVRGRAAARDEAGTAR